jgi:cyclohexadienyl dehydratase
LTACGAVQPDNRPILRVGTSGDYPPFSHAGKGFDIDVANAFADDLGYRVEWIPFAWPELERDIGAGRFDVAMSGVTWRAFRAVGGPMSRAVAIGGPCWIGAFEPEWVAVNRGGILERWARRYFAASHIVSVDDNLSLPGLLAAGDVDAIVTDSFEFESFLQSGDEIRCLVPRDAKVYWISRAAPPDLSEELDKWIVDSEERLQAFRERWFGDAAPRDEIDHLLDLIDRRLALMPDVVRWKRDHGLPIEDRDREATVIAASMDKAKALGLVPDSIRALFELQIELAKSVQVHTPVAGGTPATADLDTALRPVILRIGDGLLTSLQELVPLDPKALSSERMQRLSVWLSEEQAARLRNALLAVQLEPHSNL